MSRIRNILNDLVAAAFSLLLLSCAGPVHDGIHEDVAIGYPVNIYADAQAPTRIAHDDLDLFWEEDDTLKLCAVAEDGTFANAELSVYELDSSDHSSASFSGFVSMLSQPAECYFLYPNSSAASYNPSTDRVKFQYNSQTGRHEPMMYAKTAYNQDQMNVELRHAGAILQISVQIPDVSTLTFAGNQLEDIYPIEIDPDTDELFFSSEMGVQITVPVQTEGPTYICVPPVNLVKGFSLICSKADGSFQVKSFSSDGSLSGGYDFSDKTGSLIPIELSGDFVNFDISASGLSGSHTKYGNLLTGTEVKFTMNKSGSSNKLIEEWGANLLNEDGQIVRTIKYTNSTAISGQVVTMNVSNNWKLLPAGVYVFTPYYKMYGQVLTLPSQMLNIPDPGVTVSLNGSTSYDKYKSGNISGANSHTNTIIEGLSVTTNLDLSVVDNREVKLDGSSIGTGYWSSGTFSYGNIAKTEFRSYSCTATVKVGNLSFTDSREFHITGLPIEVDFTNTNPTNFNPSWIMLGDIKYSDSRVNFVGGSLGSEKRGALVTPKFWTANSSLVVKTSFYSCGRNVDFIDKAAYLDIYIGPCSAAPSSISMGENVIRSDYKLEYSNGDYLAWTGNITLDSSKPSLMYSSVSSWHDKALYKVRVHYSN